MKITLNVGQIDSGRAVNLMHILKITFPIRVNNLTTVGFKKKS